MWASWAGGGALSQEEHQLVMKGTHATCLENKAVIKSHQISPECSRLITDGLQEPSAAVEPRVDTHPSPSLFPNVCKHKSLWKSRNREGCFCARRCWWGMFPGEVRPWWISLHPAHFIQRSSLRYKVLDADKSFANGLSIHTGTPGTLPL